MHEDRADLDRFTPDLNTAILSAILLTMCRSKKGLKFVHTMRNELENDFMKASVIQLRGPRVPRQALDDLEAGVRLIDDVLLIAKTKREAK